MHQDLPGRCASTACSSLPKSLLTLAFTELFGDPLLYLALSLERNQEHLHHRVAQARHVASAVATTKLIRSRRKGKALYGVDVVVPNQLSTLVATRYRWSLLQQVR